MSERPPETLTELLNLKILEGSFVDDGDNPPARVALFKLRRASKGVARTKPRRSIMGLFTRTKSDGARSQHIVSIAKSLAAMAKQDEDHDPTEKPADGEPVAGITLADLLPKLQAALEPDEFAAVLQLAGIEMPSAAPAAPAMEAPKAAAAEPAKAAEPVAEPATVTLEPGATIVAGGVESEAEKSRRREVDKLKGELEAERTERKAFEAVVEKEREQAAIDVMKERVRKEYANLPADPDRLGPVLHRLTKGKATKADAQILGEALDAANETLKLSKVLGRNIGSTGGRTDSSPEGRVSKRAVEIVAEHKDAGTQIKMSKARILAMRELRQQG